MKNIYAKILAAKKEIGTISKDSKNPFFKSNYLSLNGLINAVEDVLQNQDLLLLQPLGNGGVSSIIYDSVSEKRVESFMMLPNIQDPQKLGSAITYFRRYTLQSLLGLQAEDDDANKASKPDTAKQIEQRKPALKDSQLQAILKSKNKEHAKLFLDKCRMSDDERTQLKAIL